MHGQIREVKYLKERMPKGFLSFHHLMHHKQDEDQVLRIVVSLEQGRMFVYHLANLRGILPSINLVDHYFLWYVQESSHGWYITRCQHAHQLTLLPKCCWICHRRIDDTIFVQPAIEDLVSLLVLQFFGAFPIDRIMQTLGIGIILKISHTEGQQLFHF